MCGVLGIMGPSASRYASNFDKALDALDHRGPDHRAKLVVKPDACLMGHTRLTILDVDSKANQPMQNASGALVYNGEIYNHQTIRASLKEDCQTHSDTETLLLGLQEKGVDIFKEVRGMFSGAYFDRNENSLLLFRDPVGIKPMYYLQLADSTLAFASEIKALLALLPDFPRRINRRTLSTYLTFENWAQGETFFEGIHLLKPGQMLWAQPCANGKVSLHDQALPKSSLSIDFDQNCVQSSTEWSREMLQKTVHEHLLSDFPVATYLSGGLDSGTVSYLAAQKHTDLHAFCGYFDTEFEHYDERPRARKLAEHAGINFHEVGIQPKDFKDQLDTLMYTLEEPRMGMGSFSQFMVAKQVAKTHKVIMAGHGGDEIFYGYSAHKIIRALEGRGLARIKDLSRLNTREYPWLLAYFANRLKNSKAIIPMIFNAKEAEEIAGAAPDVTAFSADEINLQTLSQYYHNTYLPGLLVVEDKISMHHGLETRVPLCDHTLAQAINAISPDIRMLNQQPKGLMKQVVQEWLPEEIVHGPKRGFPTPLRLWFNDELKDYVREILLNSSKLDALFSRKTIKSQLKYYETIKYPAALQERYAHRIWMLLSIDRWMHAYNVNP
jgi:asparagine synthase (glutamine-hydrolysing)